MAEVAEQRRLPPRAPLTTPRELPRPRWDRGPRARRGSGQEPGAGSSVVVSVQTPQRDARGLQGAPRDGPKGLCPTQAAPDRNGALERSPRHGEHPALLQIWERVLGTKPSCCSGEFPLEKPPWVFLIPSNEEPAAMPIAAAPPGDFAQAGAGKSPPSAGGHSPGTAPAATHRAPGQSIDPAGTPRALPACHQLHSEAARWEEARTKAPSPQLPPCRSSGPS